MLCHFLLYQPDWFVSKYIHHWVKMPWVEEATTSTATHLPDPQLPRVLTISKFIDSDIEKLWNILYHLWNGSFTRYTSILFSEIMNKQSNNPTLPLPEAGSIRPVWQLGREGQYAAREKTGLTRWWVDWSAFKNIPLSPNVNMSTPLNN